VQMYFGLLESRSIFFQSWEIWTRRHSDSSP